jgi:ATP-dependent protease HslVU (ClpYQ) peptidase subunit
MIFLEVTCKNGTKALINLANITTITQNLAKENVFVSFAGSVDEYITLETSIEEFAELIKKALNPNKDYIKY